MTTSARGPRLLKGAIVAADLANPLASVIVFQYNPHTLNRSLQARTTNADEGARSEALRLNGAPVETITVDVAIDAADQLESGAAITTTLGLYPQLSALELLIYPKTALVLRNAAQAALGTLELIGPQAPLTLFIWGLKRVVPVRISGMTIVEEAYDNQLNPIRAHVNLSMRVLSYSDLVATNPGYTLFLAYQIVKESMATLASINSLAGVIGGNTNLF
jgi:hypothetical protein